MSATAGSPASTSRTSTRPLHVLPQQARAVRGRRIFQAIFDEVVARCVAHGFVDGRHLTVDATHIDADASVKSLEPVTVTMGPKEYIGTLEGEPLEEEEPREPGMTIPTGEEAGQRHAPLEDRPRGEARQKVTFIGREALPFRHLRHGQQDEDHRRDGHRQPRCGDGPREGPRPS